VGGRRAADEDFIGAPEPGPRKEWERPAARVARTNDMTTRARLLLAVLVVAAAAAVLVARRSGSPPTDAERIRALLDRAARAAEERKPGEVVEVLSERFRGQGLDRMEVKRIVALHVLRAEFVSVSISGAAIDVDGDAARANVDAVLARASGRGKALAELLGGEAQAHRFRLRLEREDGEWRVVTAEWRPIALGDALAGPPDPRDAAGGGGR
jgi:hypothetical protein